MFERAYQVEWFMCNDQGFIKPIYLFRMLSEIMERNATSYGAGAEYHRKRNMVWVLIEYEIDILRMPKAEERIDVGTLPYSFKRMYGFRVYQVKDADGEIIVRGKGKFVLVDLKDKRLAQPDEDMLSKFTDAIKEPIALPFETIKHTKNKVIGTMRRTIHHGHIDANDHVNNAEYIGLAYEALPKEIADTLDYTRIKVLYKKETVIHEEIDLSVYQEMQGVLIEITNNSQFRASVYFQQKP